MKDPDPLGLDNEFPGSSQDDLYDCLPPTQVLKEQAEQRSNNTSTVSAGSTDTVVDTTEPATEMAPGARKPLVQRDSDKTLVGADENTAPAGAAGKRKQTSPAPQPEAKRARASTTTTKEPKADGPASGGQKRKPADFEFSDDEPPEVKASSSKKKKKTTKGAGEDEDGPSTSKKGKTPGRPKGKKSKESMGGGQLSLNQLWKYKSVDTTRSLSEPAAPQNEPPAPLDNAVPAGGRAVLMPKPSAPPSLDKWSILQFRGRTLAGTRPFVVADSEKHLPALARAPMPVIWAASRHNEALEKLSESTVVRAVKMTNSVDGVQSLLQAMKCTSDMEAFPSTVLEEADLESKALSVDPTAGFGGDASKDVVPGKHWYGGKVQYCLSIRVREQPKEKPKAQQAGKSKAPQTADKPKEQPSVEKTKEQQPAEKYCAVFMPLALGPSCRFSRHGSDNWIPVSISNKTFKTQTAEEWTEFFTRPFVIMGRVYHAMYSKEQSKRFLYRSPYTYPQHASFNIPVPVSGMDFVEFMDQHNPIVHNCEQSMQKHIARFALGTSNSVPICQLKHGNINLIEDLYANGKTKDTAASHEIMTDGWGYMNRAGFDAVHSVLGLTERIMAIQFRLAGAKGVLVEANDAMNGDADPTEPRVWLRPSQIKIQYPSLEPRKDYPLDVSRLILEHLRPARIKTPSRISALSIINLAFNTFTDDELRAMCGPGESPKRMRRVILEIFQNKLKEDYAALITWETYDDRVKAAQAVDILGAVTSMRRAQAAGASSRAKGMWYREGKDGSDSGVLPAAALGDDDDEDDEDDYEEDDADAEDQSTRAPAAIAGMDAASAQAFLSAAAKALQMLFAGFNPCNTAILRSHIRVVLQTSSDQYLKRFTVQIEGSAEGIIISDDSGVLGENEIFLSSSRPLLDSSGRTMNNLIGEVLIYRNPVRLPSDIQKVTAVYKPELSHYRDVIVFSHKGPRSLASKLAGGDYDGDTAVVIWDRDIVRTFKYQDDSDTSMDPEPNFKAENFTTRTRRLREYIENSPLDCHDLMRITHSACDDRKLVGEYSKLHESLEYRSGLNAKTTVAAAHKFNIILDGAKNGDKILPDVYTADHAGFGRGVPGYKIDSGKEKGRDVTRAPRQLRMHILDYLWDKGKKFVDEMLHEYEQHVGNFKERDLDLGKPWLAFADTVLSCTAPSKAVMEDVRDQILALCDQARARNTTNNAKIPKAKQAEDNHWADKDATDATYVAFREERAAIRRDIFSPANLEIGARLGWDASFARRIISSCLFYTDAVRLAPGYNWPPDRDAKFAFNMAFDELCAIKASLSDAHHYPILVPFLNHMPPRVRD